MILSLVLIAVVTLVSAAVAMSLRRLIHSALCLALNWLGVAAFYLWAGAEFVAFAQVLVYVGAISMVVLFAVLLTRQGREAVTVQTPEFERRAFAGLVTVGLVCGVLAGAALTAVIEPVPARGDLIDVRRIGELLIGPHVVALLLAGLLLTVALIGAVVLAAADPEADADPDADADAAVPATELQTRRRARA